jgi:hypothetical protein
LLITFLLTVSAIVFTLLHEWLLASVFGIFSAALIGFQLQSIRYTFKRVITLYSLGRRIPQVTKIYRTAEETTQELRTREEIVEEITEEEESKEPKFKEVSHGASERTERAKSVRNQLRNWRRRLQKLEEQRSLLGTNTRPEILIEIEDIEEEIEKLEAKLVDLEADNA